VICTEAEKRQLGIDQILEACVCRSPQGRALKARREFFSAEKREDLREEFQAITAIRDSLRELASDWRQIESILGRFRNIEGTVRGLEHGRQLDESELFELKRCFSLLRQINTAETALAAAGVKIEEQTAAADLLNPPGSVSRGFHVYSAYSGELSAIRKQKRRLETQILSAEGEDRQKLLSERSLLVTAERQEEAKQIGRLVRELQTHVDPLRRNLAAVARLDFRLAKARLAENWAAPLPEISNAGEAACIEGGWHPLLRSKLETKGVEFTRQSIHLEQGSTVISGLNMGGKSVALQTFLLCLYLLQLGYCPPCEAISSPLYDFFIYMAENPGNVSSGLSSFGMEAARLREYFRLIDKGQALLVMDEPCRGTNPHEATAIVRAICQIYSDTDSTLLLASHYEIPPSRAVYHYQIRGMGAVTEKDAAQLKLNLDNIEASGSSAKEEKLPTAACSYTKEDLEAVRRISQLMDYRLVKVEDEVIMPAGAIRIAELMGVAEDALDVMRREYSELEGEEKQITNNEEN
jgi:DNA mismatch repair ATPase MutS